MRLRVSLLLTLLGVMVLSGGIVLLINRTITDSYAGKNTDPGWLMLTALPAGCTALFFLWRYITRKVILPLEKLTRHILMMSETANHSLPPASPRNDEIEILVREFDRLFERWRRLHDGISQKIENTAVNFSDLEISLRRNQEYLKQLFDNSPIAIAQLDSHNRIIAINHAFEIIFQYSASEIIAHDIDSFLVPISLSEEGQNLTSRTFQGESISLETQRKRKDGAFLDVYIIGIPIYLDNERIGIYGMYIDITELKNTQREKIQLTEQLVEAKKMEAVGTLAGGMAHEFNNLMAIILGNTDLLLSSGFEDESLIRRFQSIQDAAGRASTLTNQLLSFSRKQLLKMERLDLNYFADSLSYIVRNLYGEKLKREFITDGRLRMVMGDQGALTQALLDIIQNSFEAICENGHVMIRFENVLLSDSLMKQSPDRSPGSFVRISVSDNGCGIDQPLISHIFEPFFTTKKQKNAVGLGLAFVYGTIRQHDGWVEVNSKMGEGTTFTIYLPALP